MESAFLRLPQSKNSICQGGVMVKLGEKFGHDPDHKPTPLPLPLPLPQAT